MYLLSLLTNLEDRNYARTRTPHLLASSNLIYENCKSVHQDIMHVMYTSRDVFPTIIKTITTAIYHLPHFPTSPLVVF